MVLKKWNQFLSKRFRESDKPDTDRLIELQNYFRIRYGISTKKEFFFMFSKKTFELVRIVESVTETEARKFNIRCPDLYFKDEISQKIIVVESDGGVHKRKTERTLNRNSDYMYADIPMIIIDLEDIEELQKSTIICWKDVIHRQMKKLQLLRS